MAGLDTFERHLLEEIVLASQEMRELRDKLTLAETRIQLLEQQAAERASTPERKEGWDGAAARLHLTG